MFFRKSTPNFMESVRQNNIDALISTSIANLTLENFEEAFHILDNFNPDWRIRPQTDLTRAYISGLEKRIISMKQVPTQNNPL
jgi:hypothetical protein